MYISIPYSNVFRPMKLYIQLLGLFCFPVILPAQYESILNDPDVIWAAELDLIFWLEPEFTAPDSVYAATCASAQLKMINHATKPDDESELLLGNKLLALLFDESKQVFIHPDSSRPLTWEERAGRVNFADTVTVIDPETFMERNAVIRYCWSGESIQKVRVKQLLFYRQKSDEFELYTHAFAPVLQWEYGALDLESAYWYHPFWFKMPPYSRKNPYKSFMTDKHITWARRMRTRENMPPLNSLKPYKDFKPPVMQQYLDRVVSDPGFKVREQGYWNVIPLSERIKQISGTDTVITFDPETYEEKTTIVHRRLQGSEVMDLRLVQDWLWDERRQYPAFLLYAFAPLEPVRDKDGNLRFKRPIFWRKLDD